MQIIIFGCSILGGFFLSPTCKFFVEGLTVLFYLGLGDIQSAGKSENGVKLSFDSLLNGAKFSDYSFSTLGF